ncbi:unnamed protein product [Parnassius mnemosyne]|uniref:Transposase n=1 Tax=Parnassius mnemosyne TaxID=213953 RepID=A0AAV1LGV6_9NEOP
MGNAPYHSLQKDKAPTSSSRKLELISWLQSKGIEANKNMLKPELVRLVKENKSRKSTYILDEITEQHGHTVLRLPPYHCHYNAIERIWAYFKGSFSCHYT